MPEEKAQSQFGWAMAVHTLGWNNLGDICDHNHCLWEDAIDLVAHQQLTNAVASEQWLVLDPVIFIIRATLGGSVQKNNTFETNHLIVGELLPVRGGLDGRKLCDDRFSIYRQILKEMHPNPSPIYGENAGIGDHLNMGESRIRTIHTDDRPDNITSWYKDQILRFGGNLDIEHPQNNISSWFNRIYHSTKPTWLWGVPDLLEEYCDYPFGTKSMPRHIACYPNIQFYHRDFLDVFTDSASYEWIRRRNDNRDLSVKPVAPAPNEGDKASGELV